MIYFILLAVFILLGVLDIVRLKKKYRVIFFGISILFLICLSSIRWKTGTDWMSYFFYFTSNKSYSDFNDGAFEIGFATLNFAIRAITKNYSIFLMVMAILVIGIKGLYIYRNADLLLITLMLYFAYYIGDIFAVRQALAISITLYSTKFIISREKWKFLFLVILATSIHNTAFIFLPAYYIYHKRFSNKQIILFLGIAFLIGLSGLSTIFLDLVVKVVGTQGRIGEKLSIYLQFDKQISASEISTTTAFLLGSLKRALIIPLLIVFRKNLDSKYSYFSGYLNLLVFGNVIYFIFAGTLSVMIRSASYFYIYEILLIPLIINVTKDMKFRLMAYSFIALFAVSKLIFALSGYWDLFVPYYTIFHSNIPRNLY